MCEMMKVDSGQSAVMSQNALHSLLFPQLNKSAAKSILTFKTEKEEISSMACHF